MSLAVGLLLFAGCLAIAAIVVVGIGMIAARKLRPRTTHLLQNAAEALAFLIAASVAASVIAVTFGA